MTYSKGGIKEHNKKGCPTRDQSGISQAAETSSQGHIFF